jgi:DNA-directed RNA polymerase subunit RPC12/RpoP
MAEMVVQCPDCGHQLDPNARDAPVEPPSDLQKDLLSLRCPKCGVRRDFGDWILRTDLKPSDLEAQASS